MSDYESRHEIDDELLSAYLDDELSPDQRAAVEARLAQDPAARETLHQLRAVSQAVQALPQEIVGHDLGEAVLRRVSPGEPPSPPADLATTHVGASSIDRAAPQESSLPKLTIGRTRRGWVWASLAVAAALLVMVFQPDRRGEEELPAVALHNEQVREELGPAATRRGELEFRSVTQKELSKVQSDMETMDRVESALPEQSVANRDGVASGTAPLLEPAAQPSDERASNLSITADRASEFAPSAPDTQMTSDSGATSATAQAPARSPAGAEAGTATDLAAVDSLSTPQFGAASRELTEQLTEVPTQEEQPVVIRVLARREALANKSFDQVLESNGIQVDSVAPDSASMPTVRAQSESKVAEQAEQSESELLRGNAGPNPTSGSEEELVLVDAPAEAIELSLQTLNADAVNYLGIKIDEAGQTSTEAQRQAGATADYSTQDLGAFAKQRAAANAWSRFNRGVVPSSDDGLARDKLSYYMFSDEPADRYGVARGFRGGYGGATLPQPVQQQAAGQGQPLGRNELGERRLGRAMRLRTWAIEDQSPPEQRARRRTAVPDQSLTRTVQPADQAPELRQQLREGSDRVQVLFVISPADAPASSPPARNKAQ
jgi:hypothetical protein